MEHDGLYRFYVVHESIRSLAEALANESSAPSTAVCLHENDRTDGNDGLCRSFFYCMKFIINEYFEHEFRHEAYLELKISIRSRDCVNITSVSLLG